MAVPRIKETQTRPNNFDVEKVNLIQASNTPSTECAELDVMAR